MTFENTYLALIAALVSGVWILVMYIRDRHAAAAQNQSAIMGQLAELDKIHIEHPDIQKYMALTADKSETYFLDRQILQDELFYKAKAFAYMYLNFFDAILSSSKHSRSGPPLLAPPALIELADWEQYIRRKLRHPLYGAILNQEAEIFGCALRDFWNANNASIQATEANPFVW